MAVDQLILIIVSGLGVIHGLFLSIFAWFYEKGNLTANKILSLLLLVLSFRVGKSVLLEFSEDLHVKIIFIGLGTLMLIGPLFFHLVKVSFQKDFRIKFSSSLHFLPAMLAIIFGFWIREEHLETLPNLLFLSLFITYYIHLLFYLIRSHRELNRYKNTPSVASTYQLLQLMIWGLYVIWFAYVLNLLDEMIPYVYGPILYSLVAYVISFEVIRKGHLAKVGHEKYQSTPASDQQTTELFENLCELVEQEEWYKDASITLKLVSSKLKVTPQSLSMAVNSKSGSNFNQFINRYRIEAAIRHFQDEHFDHLNIASIAFEVGFNSISSFNTAFKQHTGKTPLSYRKSLSK